MNFRVLLVLLVLQLSFFLSGQSLFDEKSTQKYAHYLYSNNDYEQAAREYSRLVLMDSSNEDYLNKSLICYRLSENYLSGIQLINTFDLNVVGSANQKEYLHLMIKSKQWNLSDSLLDGLQYVSLDDRLFYRTAFDIWQNGTRDFNNEVRAQYTKDSISLNWQNLKTIVFEDEQFKSKSKGLALGMSMLVPGTGKMYLGAWKDGLAVLVYTSLSAWQSYRGFDRRGVKSAYGWIYGAVGTGFYLGNIYGTGKFHRIRLEKHRLKIQEMTENVLEASFNP